MKHIVIETRWSPDIDERWDDPLNKDWTRGEDPDDWQCWESRVVATAIVDGQFVTGSAYLGGIWEKWGNDPSVSNPTISGYYPQMLEEALEELRTQLPPDHPAMAEILDTAATTH